MRKICVITGTRADYGLLRCLMQAINDSSHLELEIIATGTQLSPEFGLTFREIEADGFYISRKLEILLSSDTPAGIAKSMGLALSGIADVLADSRPDLMLVLGDRFEIFSAVAAALVARVPVAHLHGGEVTEGVIDESMRHSITKMSHLHFVATEEYRRRVIQLGESPERVFCVGGMGVDAISKMTLLSREVLQNELNFEFGDRCLMVTFHPVTLEHASAESQMVELLRALEATNDASFIFTMPNADTEGRVIFSMINEFVRKHPGRAKTFTSLGQLKYLSCLQFVKAVVGNSSSGLLEVPSFGKPTVNIGDRQRGRTIATSVINCEPNRDAICAAIQKALSSEFQNALASVVNPYGTGGASERIVSILEKTSYSSLLKKRFYNLSFE
jgi:GDP/UDP-N,N'-diacetylbacillosamine 2-epimerase (hydrolysing)